MKLENIYKGNVVKCIGFNEESMVFKKFANNKVFCRYGKNDKIIKYNVTLAKMNDDYFYDLSSIVDVEDYINLCEDTNDSSIEKVYFVPQKDGDLYVDVSSLKEYKYNEYEVKKTR